MTCMRRRLAQRLLLAAAVAGVVAGVAAKVAVARHGIKVGDRNVAGLIRHAVPQPVSTCKPRHRHHRRLLYRQWHNRARRDGVPDHPCDVSVIDYDAVAADGDLVLPAI